MPALQPALGVVFEIDRSPYLLRVIAFDEVEVMYDVWWPHAGAWSMARLLGTFTYYRLSRQYFDTHARYVRTDPLSEKELQVHRPDLPFAVARHLEVSWYEPSWQGQDFGRTPVIPVNALYLRPFGPRDSAKPSILLTADDGVAFTEAELLDKAKALQTPFIGDVRLTEGVGLYRDGFRKRLPSYYLWGARSRSEAPSMVSSHAARLA